MPEEQWERVASHLETCAACEDTISSLDGTADSMLDHLRTPPSQSIAGTPEYLAAMAKLQNQSAQGAPTSSRAGDPESPNQIDAHRPDVVRDYKLIAILGAGGMGTVYKAIHTKLDRVVALKLLPTRRIGNADAIVRFEREMKAIGKLDHPAIVRATDAGDDDGQHFLAMEFVDGFDVSELVDRHGPLTISDASEIIRQAAIGLQHVHERQLVHRDIKPSNLMVTEDGHVKILDLGLALLADQHEGLGELTTVGQMMGTVDYMAPEQCDDSHDVDIRADIYSLGATLFKMLTGRAPYATSERRSPLSRIRALATEEPPQLADSLPDADAEFCSIVDRMLSRNPDDRFATPGDVATALEKFTEDHDLTQAVAVAADAPAPASRPPLPSPRKLAPDHSAAVLSSETSNTPRTKRSTTATLLAMAVVLAAATFTFRLQTDKGELVVECNVPNVEVLLLKDGEVYDELSLKQGTTSVSVFSGKYEIRIPGNADSIEISANRFTVSRGSKLIAQIRQVETPEHATSLLANATETKVEPKYSGKTFSQWKEQLADRNPSEFRPALDAVGELGVGYNADEAGRLIFEAVKPLFRHSSKMAPLTFPTPSGTTEDVTRYIAVQAFRPLLDDPGGVELLREFLTEGDTARRYALSVLDCREEIPSSSAPGYAAAQRALAAPVPALLAASHDEDLTVRTRAIRQLRGFEKDYAEIIPRYVEMVGSPVFKESHDASVILFRLTPEHHRLIGERHLKFYVDNAENFRAMDSASYRFMYVRFGDEDVEALDLLSAAVEGGVRSKQLTEILFGILNDSQCSTVNRVRAAHLLAIHLDSSTQLVPNLINLLQSDSLALDDACSTQGFPFTANFVQGTQAYQSFRAAIFDILGKIGPDAKNAIPVLNDFLNEIVNPTPVARAQNRKLDRADNEATGEAIEALSKIGLNAELIPILKFFLQWPVMKSVKPDIADLASRALRSIPAEELKRLRAKDQQDSPLQR
jgi:serine/threonine protein kinase